jgi:hypothetical protein
MTAGETPPAGSAPRSRRPLGACLIVGLLNLCVLVTVPLLADTYLGLPLLAFQAVVCLPATLIVVLPRRSRPQSWSVAIAVAVLFVAGALLNLYIVSGYTD